MSFELFVTYHEPCCASSLSVLFVPSEGEGFIFAMPTNHEQAARSMLVSNSSTRLH